MSVPDQKLVLPKQFDNVTKRGIRRDPKGFVTTLLGIEADEFEVIETEQLSMKTHVADSFIRVTTGDKQAIVHCEFQTHDSRDAPMPFRGVYRECCGLSDSRGIGLRFSNHPRGNIGGHRARIFYYPILR